MDIQKLTKKNQEFIHIATNQLIKDGKSDQEIKDILGNVIPELLENQKKGITGRNLLGAPTVWAASSLLKNIHSLTQTRPAKKSQKQIKHLGRCGLIPHFSFSPLLPS